MWRATIKQEQLRTYTLNPAVGYQGKPRATYFLKHFLNCFYWRVDIFSVALFYSIWSCTDNFKLTER